MPSLMGIVNFKENFFKYSNKFLEQQFDAPQHGLFKVFSWDTIELELF
jgi:hypothetical protein